MLAYRPESGYEAATSAVALAREIEDIEIEADALVTLGCARVSLGDPTGVKDLEHALGLVGHRGRVAARALNNLGWAYSVIGDLSRALRVSEENAARAAREGDAQDAWFSRGTSPTARAGRWDEAMHSVDSFDSAPEGARYMQTSVRSLRANILAARDRPEAALREIRDVVAISRPAMDPQAAWPSLVESLGCSAPGTRRRGGGVPQRVDRQHRRERVSRRCAGVGHPARARVRRRGPLAGSKADRRTAFDRGLARGCDAVLDARYVAAQDLLEATGGQPLQAELRLAPRRVVSEGKPARRTLSSIALAPFGERRRDRIPSRGRRAAHRRELMTPLPAVDS